MPVLRIVQHLTHLTDNADTVKNSDPAIVNTGVYRVSNADTVSAHFVIGGNPDAGVATGVCHLLAGQSILVKASAPKRAQVIGITKGATTVLNVQQDGRAPSHPFVVGDYVTLTGSSVAAYNSGIAHLAITAVTDTTITVGLDSSAYSNFTGTATLSNSIKVSAQGDSNNGLTLYTEEVQVVGG
jgi:hypothetical protein